MSTRWLRRAALLLLGAPVVLSAIWLVAGTTFRHGDREDLPPEGPQASSDVPVTVAPATRRPLRRTVEAMGTLHPFEEVALAARIEGRVVKVLHDVADRVRPDEVLLEIDPKDYDLAVEQAERALHVELARLGLDDAPAGGIDAEKVPAVMQARTKMENAKNRFDRSRRLLASRAASAEELEGLLTESRSAQAEHANQVLMARTVLATARLRQTALAVARQQQRDTRVRVPTPSRPAPGAPAAAYAITARSAAEGALVRPGTEVFKLVICQTLKLRVAVPERYSGEVKPGQTVDVHTSASARPVLGTVTRINPAVAQTTRTFQVEVEVPNPSGELKPGSFARALIRTREGDPAVTVPLSAVVQFAGVTKVFLADNGRAREVQVTLGDQSGDWVEITSPALPDGALVITSGQTVLARDTPIRVR